MTPIRRVRAEDAAAIAAIYAPFVRETAVSFETEAPDAAEMAARIASTTEAYPWLVAVNEQDEPIGYAYATGFRARHAYRFVVETTVYVAPPAQAIGIGRALYERLLETLIRQGFTQAIAAIALPNIGSVRLHESVGFQQTGVYRQVGYKLGGWHDVGLWQRELAGAGDAPREPVRFADLGRADRAPQRL